MLTAATRSAFLGALLMGLLFFGASTAHATVTEVRKCFDPEDDQTCVIMLIDDG